ncbi:hypothetical protein NBRC3188_3329 [Acetobacter pasteurianus NBRC 3188]|uniref:Uncharacterized protein n=1 Tax=Acetobacter pasteurianus NBRC 3188 TaxID=1226663 RepID=A0A401WZ51_ACEPA|nr:hypothetical protein NBRC3188_3329 [Acetobacter pasteurianus NBRC 3188]
MVNIRIHRPRTRRALTELKLCDPPETCITASVRPCVGRTAPSESGSQSIWFLNTAVMLPCRSGLHQTWPSDQIERSRSSCTFGWVAGTESATGRPVGSNTRVSAPSTFRMRSASSTSNRLKDRGRKEPKSRRIRGGWSTRGCGSSRARSTRSRYSGWRAGKSGSVIVILVHSCITSG